METSTLPPNATPVEGSDGLLLEVDGQIVPNYDATIVPFEEGDVVSGRVVRIDKDEVLVDIGYKSEGVILANELSIRKSANPFEEVELGEEVDALVLTKEVRQQILDRLQPGQIVEGAISNIVDFGAFVDLDGIDGLIHISELSWSHVNHPSEILSIGDVVPVKVLDIDSERRRLSLSVKRVEEQLPHIRSAAEAGAAAAAEAGGGQDIGDVADLGLSEDVFAGPSISGVDALREALPSQAPAEEAAAEEAPAAEEA